MRGNSLGNEITMISLILPLPRELKLTIHAIQEKKALKPCITDRRVSTVDGVHSRSSTEIKKTKSVNFVPGLVTKYVESIWKDEEEMREVYAEWASLSPKVSRLEMNSRKSLIQFLKLSRRNKTQAYFDFFTENSLGIRNLTEEEDKEIERKMMHSFEFLKQSIVKELEWAPQIFREIHPFEDNLIFYFNSVLGRTKQDKSPSLVKRKCGNTLDRYKYLPQTHIPIALERTLWLYRRTLFRQWFSTREQDTEDTKFLADDPFIFQLKITKIIDNPMDYFMTY